MSERREVLGEARHLQQDMGVHATVARNIRATNPLTVDGEQNPDVRFRTSFLPACGRLRQNTSAVSAADKCLRCSQLRSRTLLFLLSRLQPRRLSTQPAMDLNYLYKVSVRSTTQPECQDPGADGGPYS